jgi:hypothetical protein
MSGATRVFLGWDAPVLPRVAAWLLESAASPLDEVIVVVPGRRSGRLLLSHLVAMVERERGGGSVVPPRVVTPGALPELFYRPARPVATRRERVLAWCDVLAPTQSEISARIAFARDLVRCQDELGEEGLRIGDVPGRAAAAIGAGGEAERWQSLAALEVEELAAIERGGRVDPTAARLDALADAVTERLPAPVVLCGIAALRGLERRFLERFASSVTALVAASEREAALFDGWGSIDVEAWRKRQVTVPREALTLVDRPRAQAQTVAAQVAGALDEGSAPGPGERLGVTVGLGDASLSGVVVTALAERGLEAHDALGRPLAASAPWWLIAAVGRYAETRTVNDLAPLLRHPDLERHLAPRLEAAAVAAGEASSRELREAVERRDWLTVLDLYTSETALEPATGALPGDAVGAAVVAAMDDAVLDALNDGGGAGDDGGLRSLGDWTSRLCDFLLGVYGDRTLLESGPDRLLANALRRLAEELRAQSQACAQSSGGPIVRLVDAIELLASEVAGESLLDESEPGAIEVMGWLELPLDDAPRLVVAGLDEASAVSALAGSLLSPPLRRSLGLQDAETLLARDLYYLELLMASRETSFIAGRRGAQGEPLSLRRILLAGATSELVETVLSFWGDAGRERDEEADAAREESAFRPILPSSSARLPDRLPVTAFRDYLACPYRFYLRHVLGLRQVRDLPRELLPGDFGRLLHAVLGRFARSPAAASGDAATIARMLEELLEEEAASRSGRAPRVAVRLQLEQLRRRLRSFASWQAAQARAGWTIHPDLVEVRVEATLDVDGEPFVVSGRLDRVDRHPTGGARLLDYKSAEQSITPEQAHRAGKRGERRWIDLQLPLYELMLRQRGLGADVAIELGFVNLGQRLTGEPLVVAEWNAGELAEALETARGVVRAIRARRFWPPGEPPSYLDGFEGLAGDAFADRARYLSAGG